MILADTAIWVDHLRQGDAALAALLERGLILSHPFVIGEIALGGLRRRPAVLRSLAELPKAVLAEDGEVMRLIIDRDLGGAGIGWVDAHLLAAVMLTPGAALWTRDARLRASAARMGLAHQPDGRARSEGRP